MQLPLRSTLAELVLVDRLCLDGPGRLVEAGQVKERPLLGLLLPSHRLRIHDLSSSVTVLDILNGVGQLAILVPRKLLGPAGVEVCELVTAAATAELLEQVIKGDHVLVTAQAQVTASDLSVREWQWATVRRPAWRGCCVQRVQPTWRRKVTRVCERTVVACREVVVHRIHDGHGRIWARRRTGEVGNIAQHGFQALGEGNAILDITIEASPELVHIGAQARLGDACRSRSRVIPQAQ
mmetsp:Transcript_53672/g.73586  ORF Transcript_53672/g.73586 Transcript_53672/m.73586 type:complete len:238 (+) Transcript_53672:505-1218(+)